MNKSGRLLLFLFVIVIASLIIQDNDTDKAAKPDIQGTNTESNNDQLECSNAELSLVVSSLPTSWSCNSENNELELLSESYDIQVSKDTYNPFCRDTTLYDDTGNLMQESPCKVESFYINDGFILSSYYYDDELKEIGGSYTNLYGDKLGVHIVMKSPPANEEELKDVLNLID